MAEHADDLLAELRRAGLADVDDSPLARALYSSDASLYRVPPRAVVRPRHIEEIEATLAVCHRLGVPLTARGAGTSIAGNAVGPGVVLDTSRHLGRVLEVSAEEQYAVVEPGAVHASVQRAARPWGLRFGPDPSTHNRCTVGGMIGNNACGSRALAYGRTSDNVLALDVLTGAGQRLRLDGPSTASTATAVQAEPLSQLRELVAGNLATLRTQFGRFSRQGSGYCLEHLLPERGFDVARALVGSEGTLALVLGATVRLVVDEPVHRLVILGYPAMADAADATPALLVHRPTACEGLDQRIVDRVLAQPTRVLPDLPRGDAWLLVELAGQDEREVTARAAKVIRAAGAVDAMVVTDPAHAAAVWRVREDGAGLASRAVDGRPAHSGWEDAAVPVVRLGAYLRDADALLADHGLTGVPYGHFGDGCVHVRIDFPLGVGADAGRQVFRRFLHDAARLVASYGGSLSGEHGDGRARSELLPLLYPPEALALLAQVKSILDPADLLNPGVLVRPDPVDTALRLARVTPVRAGLALSYPADGGDLAAAVHRCTGVARCRVEQPSPGVVMCPSYLATRDEKDSTRGRARVLQEMVTHRGGPDWDAPEVHAALDLCLSCKGCASDCPTGVDMAAWKAEVLYQTYRGRPRPRSHYTLGRLPRWARLAAHAPSMTNRVLASRWGGRLTRLATGVDPRRELPRFASETFSRWWRARTRDPTRRHRPGQPTVVLWVDSFTDHFDPRIGQAAVTVLERAGYAVDAVTGACCGLTWISTGQLDQARRILGATLNRLSGGAPRPIIGLEPSCTAVLRHDATLLLGDEPSRAVAARVRTLAEHLTRTPSWDPPDLAGLPVLAQPHCHHHAVLGWTTDAALLDRAGAAVTRVGGCCGLAGNWGAERGHHEVSEAIARQQLLPALHGATTAVVLADGFSCRTQIAQLAQRPALHLAQLLAQDPPS